MADRNIVILIDKLRYENGRKTFPDEVRHKFCAIKLGKCTMTMVPLPAGKRKRNFHGPHDIVDEAAFDAGDMSDDEADTDDAAEAK